MAKIRVLLVEDHTIVRQGLCMLLNAHDDFEVVGEAKDGIEAIEKTTEQRPDIVVMDITLPGLNGIEATRQIKSQFPEIKVVVLTMHNDKDYIRKVFQAGATCYLSKESADAEFISTLLSAYHNKAYLCPKISKLILENSIHQSRFKKATESLDLLTVREKIILQLIAEGHSSKEVANRLSISVNTINNHRSNIMKKLNIHDATGLTRYAVKKGLIKP
ncbi:MAG: response regulator [Candidatus Brocadiales bacterium]